MSEFIRGRHVARIVVLLVAVLVGSAAGAVSRQHRSADPTTESAHVVRVDRQQVVRGARLLPAAAPVPASSRVPAHRVAMIAPLARSHAQRARHHRQARRVKARAVVRQRRVSYWQHAGGRDIGWPQCPRSASFGGRHGLGEPMPDPGVDFVVVGLTNGRGFTPNPCLARQLRWVRHHHVQAAAYAFSTYPTRGQLRRHRHDGPYDGRRFLGALGNTAYASARYSIRVMERNGFRTPHVWLDVEPSSTRPWSHRKDWNRVVVRSWITAYHQAGYAVGVYSTRLLWHDIVGGLRTGLPEWRTVGPESARSALHGCSEESFQGGPAVLVQWWTTHRDYDRLCPSGSRAATYARYFHAW